MRSYLVLFSKGLGEQFGIGPFLSLVRAPAHTVHKRRHRPRELLNCVRELDDLHGRSFDAMMRMKLELVKLRRLRFELGRWQRRTHCP